MAEETPLFSPSLISPNVQNELPEGYRCRPLQRSDYSRGFLDVLRVLTTVGDISEEMWNERYEWMSQRGDQYYLMVIVDESRSKESEVVGTGALIVERKL
jgi:glucosamine-phosphate N-acetyltransferase